MSTLHKVEAVLLLSEGNPRTEIRHAINAVARFAIREVDATEEQFLKCARAAFLLAKVEVDG